MENPFEGSHRPSVAWILQAASGMLLLVLLALHLVANHFVVPGGLRGFGDVVGYLRSPVVLALEVLFLVVVTTHALLGVRAIVLDHGPSDRAQRTTDRVLLAVGAATLGYALWLTWVVVS